MIERAEPPDAPFWSDTNGDEALHRNRALFNTIDDGTYQLDADGRFVAINDGLVVEEGSTSCSRFPTRVRPMSNRNGTGTATVLLVEDNPGDVHLTTEAFRRARERATST